MIKRNFASALLLSALLPAAAYAENFSTSVLDPSALPSNGVVAGSYPVGGGAANYYFAVDLKPGALASQIAAQGGGDYKTLTLALLDGSGRKLDSYYITAGADGREATRVFPVDAGGRYIVRVTPEGPEAGAFRVALGGSAAPGLQPAEAAAGNSQSYFNPTPLPADGVISGKFPGGAHASYYYLAGDLKAGNLMTQITLTGRPGAMKWASLELLNEQGRVDQEYHLSRTDASADATRSFAIDRTGKHVLRLTVQGGETSAYKIEFGGDALAAK
ncbi:hypothetical protein V3H18_12015 [Methylocystis sp. 9N]|uniref:Peptidase C-terminal archaeal/bacterial domain-containing protein n=1 Tax=Methylocystis borbori TaxID=3118750 RepID=A0ABU7XIR2_9HYPH